MWPFVATCPASEDEIIKKPGERDDEKAEVPRVQTLSRRAGYGSAGSYSFSFNMPFSFGRSPHSAWLTPTLRAVTVAALLVPSVFADPKPSVGRSEVRTGTKLTYYRDARNYGTMNIMTSAAGLPLGLQFWGFTDIHGNQGADEFTRYFMEYRLSRALPKQYVGIKGLGFQVEYNDFHGAGNSLARVGLTFRHRTYGDRGWLQWRYFPVETDGDGGQASLIYFFPISKRASIGGFVDWNWTGARRGRWVLEPQLTYRLTDRLAVALELRHNDFERINPRLQGTGVALGLEAAF